MDWKEQLDKKEKELNLKKEVTNEVKFGDKNRSHSSGSDNRNSISQATSNSNNSTGSGSGGLFRGRISSQTRQINNIVKKGGNRMITVDGALKDLEAIEKEATDAGSKAVVKALKVVVKFLSTMRSNQLLTDDEKVSIRKAKETRKEKEDKK